MATRAERWDQAKRRYLQAAELRTGATFRLEGRGARWASGPAGTVAIMASGSRDGEHWWFSLEPDEFERRGALGLILLCGPSEPPLDFPIPRARVLDVLPQLRRDRLRGEVKLNLALQAGRYVIQVPEGRDVDVTSALGDLSWLAGGSHGQGPAPGERVPTPNALREDAAFYAYVRRGVLEPLDSPGLPDGTLVIVRATVAPSVPGIAALRRIVASGGPTDLPTDLAERHDHYAHGAHE